jgi:hypothetical protein
MKKLSIMKINLITALIAFEFSGCMNSNMIKISKIADGTTQYKIYNKISLDIEKFKTYNNWDVHHYTIDVTAIGKDVEFEIEHTIRFTIGSGVADEDYRKKYLYHGLIDFEIAGLETRKKANVFAYKNGIIKSWTEGIKKIYSKKDFIAFVLNHDTATMKIHASNYKVKSRIGNRTINILGMKKLKKFALCLENHTTCIDKKQ